MFSYENGLVIAFVLWLAQAIGIIALVNSTRERNLNRIGMRLSWATGMSKPMAASDMSRSFFSKALKYFLIVGFSLPFVLLSWVDVAMRVGMFLYRRAKDSGAPRAIREYRWKLGNMDLSFDEHVKELIKVSEERPANFETFRASLVRELQARCLHMSESDSGGIIRRRLLEAKNNQPMRDRGVCMEVEPTTRTERAGHSGQDCPFCQAQLPHSAAVCSQCDRILSWPAQSLRG